MLDRGNTRYHAEVKIVTGGRDARINVFADTLAEIFVDVGHITAQYPTETERRIEGPSRAQLDIGNSLNTRDHAAARQAEEAELFGNGTRVPVCPSCGTDESMELVNFKDKKTGGPRQAWKCQACGKWYWPNRR
jgi:formate dehydrogenase maturation protein FdhE